jgi:hypothetical protein
MRTPFIDRPITVRNSVQGIEGFVNNYEYSYNNPISFPLRECVNSDTRHFVHDFTWEIVFSSVSLTALEHTRSFMVDYEYRTQT